MGLLASAVASVRNTVPFLRPLREVIIGFAITGWLISKIPISGVQSSQCLVHLCIMYVLLISPEEAKAKSRKLLTSFWIEYHM